MDIAVVGAGMIGLTAGIRLSQNGHRVTIYEKEPFIGGLVYRFGQVQQM